MIRRVEAVLLFYFFVTFWEWQQHPSLSRAGDELFVYCPFWPFEDARGLIFLDAWSTMVLLRALALLALVAALVPGGRFALASLAVLTLVKTYYYLSSLLLMGNYHHMHLILCLLYLAARERLLFVRLGLVVIYWMSALAKLTPSWLAGEYFNSVPGHLPLLPAAPGAVTAASLGLLVLEALGPLLLFSRRRRLRIAAAALFVMFHLYSGIIVGFFYPTLMLGVVVAAFVPPDPPLLEGYRFSWRDLPGWLILGLCLLGGVYGYLIPGDVRTTGEGRYLGMCMFDANRAAEAEIEIWRGERRYLFRVQHSWPRREVLDWRTTCEATVYAPGEAPRRTVLSGPFVEDGQVLFNPAMFRTASRMFSDPYLFYFYARELERRAHPDRIAVRLWQQLDGHSERFMILDIQDFAREAPRYSGWGHNDWIRLPGRESRYQWP